MGNRVEPPDMEHFLTEYIRQELASLGSDAQVTDQEPSAKGPNALSIPLEHPYVVIRDDSGPKGELLLFDRSIGVSILAGESRQDRQPSKDLAALVFSIMTDSAILDAPGSPIAAINDDGWFGPEPVIDALDLSRYYFTGEYTAVGTF